MGKPTFCIICEDKDADQLTAQLISPCFRYTDSTIPLLSEYEISSLYLLWLHIPVCVRPGGKPRRPVFSERSIYYTYKRALDFVIYKNVCASF